MDNAPEEETLTLPRQPADMVSFLIGGLTRAKQEGLDDTAIIATFHDYACFWLMHVAAEEDGSEPLPVTNETNKRYN